MVDNPEEARLQALHELDLLDTDPNEMFDRITRMAAQLFQLPIAAISLTDVDRQWFKSRIGVDHVSLPRDKAPCAQVTDSADMLVIPDLHEDDRYQDSPLARSGVRFYAGAPLTTRSGFVLGAMCVLGLQPRQILPQEMASLSDLAAMVMEQIELQHAFRRVDPLSKLPNRHQFVEDLDDLAKELPHGERRHLVIVDLASAQQLSDATRVMGSSYLDEMVMEAARAMSTGSGRSRKTYHVAPMQFAFLAPAEIDESGYATRLSSQLEHVRNSDLYRLVATTVIGIAPFATGQDAPDAILRTAQSAAQDARLCGTRVSVYSSVQDAAQQRRFALRHDFGNALDAADQLSLVYQPRVEIASGRCVGAEALLRWRHPTIGNISPSEFIPIVEQTWLTRATTIWVMNAALDQLAAWRRIGIDIPLSINVSAANLTESDFLERMIDGLASRGLPPECLELEITESAIMENADKALSLLEAIAATGVRLAIDDFGTGYSSLSYLQRLPVHVVKIDRSFMDGLADDGRKRSLVSTMISLSHDLGYRVVAEGVETEAMLEFVRSASCDEAQGYLFSRPLEPHDLTVRLSGLIAPAAAILEQDAMFSVGTTLALRRHKRSAASLLDRQGRVLVSAGPHDRQATRTGWRTTTPGAGPGAGLPPPS